MLFDVKHNIHFMIIPVASWFAASE